MRAEPRFAVEHREQHAKPVFGCEDCITAGAMLVKHRVRPKATEEQRRRDRARTTAAHAAIERGEHPYTHRPLAGNGETCGTCVFFNVGHRERYFKCSHPLMPAPTHGPATDIRKRWPACDWWKP